MNAKHIAEKLQHPAIPPVIISMLLGLAVTSFVSFTDLEKKVQANDSGLKYERKLQTVVTGNIKEKLEQLKKDTEKIREEMKEGNKQITDMLQQLILNGRTNHDL